jgi:WhiB family redox-sensing transcriptional regulator
MTWFESALCRGKTHLFYGDELGRSAPAKRRQRETVAKSICAVCPVVDECLKTALENDDDFGIWGGLTPNERYAVKHGSVRRRRRPKSAA